MVGTFWIRRDGRLFEIVEWSDSNSNDYFYGYARELRTNYGQHFTTYNHHRHPQELTIGGHPCKPISEDELPFYLLNVE